MVLTYHCHRLVIMVVVVLVVVVVVERVAFILVSDL